MKAIENLGIFNGKAYHKRYLKIEFGQPHIQFFEKKSDSTFHKLQKQDHLITCEVLNEEAIETRIKERSVKRSSSFLSRLMKDEIKRCSWNFAFNLVFSNGRDYELYAPTRGDRDMWVKILSTIAEINRQGLSLQDQNPIDYMKEQEMKTKAELEEAKMTESARYHASKKELE